MRYGSSQVTRQTELGRAVKLTGKPDADLWHCAGIAWGGFSFIAGSIPVPEFIGLTPTREEPGALAFQPMVGLDGRFTRLIWSVGRSFRQQYLRFIRLQSQSGLNV